MFGVLEQSGWLAEQPAGFRDWAAGVARPMEIAAGEFVYRAGEVPDGIYGLKAGTVEIGFPLVSDAPVSLLHTTQGFWVGDLALLSQNPRLVSVRTVEDCRFLFLPGQAIRDLLVAAPEHWRCFYDLSARNTHVALTLLAESLSLTVRARVCRMLLHLAGNRVEAQVTQEGLAKMLGIARPTLSRCMQDLAAQGAIGNGYRRVRILDRALLESYRDEQ